MLSRTFSAFGRSRPGFLSEKEFKEILTSFVCCEEIFYHHFFQLFDRDQDGYITEVDFISGMLAISPISAHDVQTASGQLRLQLIFLYYDANRNGRLDVEELSLMIEHLEQLRLEKNDKGPKLEMRQIAVSDAKSLMSLYKGGFWFRCLYDASVKGMLTGMEQLLRTSGDLATAILKINPQLGDPETLKPERILPAANLPQYVSPTANAAFRPPMPAVSYSGSPLYSGVAAPAAPAVASYASAAPHTVATGAPCVYTGMSLPPVGPSGSSLAIPLPLRIIRGLMDYTSTGFVDWRGLKLLTDAEMLELCALVSPILASEDSLVTVGFPARIYGDIHGNLPDLIQLFTKYSWPDKRRGDILSMNYVFLGDYVDRGAFSVEVVALLFAAKILYPTRVHLVRGNHEDRNLNANFGFKKSCVHHFGSEGGDFVWKSVNDVFDNLPLAALVGDEVFCIHGGIGQNIDSVADIMGIQKPIVVPPENIPVESLNKVDRVVLDALWSDPDASSGAAQSPRGSGVSRFSSERVKSFVSRNNLQLVVRGHECVQNGYEYFADGLLLTLFSASSYCNQHANDGAIVTVVKNQDGSMEEHVQIIKTNPDTRVGWEDVQFRQPTPMRSMNVLYGGSSNQLPQQPMQMPFISKPGSPPSGKIF